MVKNHLQVSEQIKQIVTTTRPLLKDLEMDYEKEKIYDEEVLKENLEEIENMTVKEIRRGLREGYGFFIFGDSSWAILEADEAKRVIEWQKTYHSQEKIMDKYEKLYNEALERARKIHSEIVNNEIIGFPGQIEGIFPELRESEDEIHRKWILEYLYDGLRKADEQFKPHFKSAIDWLEKQKYDRMKPIYDARESFESALEKAWNDYHNGYENVDKLEDDYVECAHAKGFREGYLFGIEKQKEQKPASTEDMPYITDEHFYEREPTDSFKYKLAEYMTKCCTKKEGPYGYEYGISAESILKMAKEELIRRGELKEQKPAWNPSEEQMDSLRDTIVQTKGYSYSMYLPELYEQLKKL